MKRIIPLTAVAAVLIISIIAPSLASLSTGQLAPDFHLVDLQNNTTKLSDYRGHVVVIDFFSANCSECQLSAKNDLVPLYSNYSSKDVKVQFLSIETTNASATTINSTYVNSTGITWPVLTDGGDLARLYGSGHEPTVYVIDPSGNVSLSIAHPIDVQKLKAAIDNLLEASKTSAPTTTSDTASRATPTPTNATATATPSTPASFTLTHPVATLNTPTSETPKSTATPQSQQGGNGLVSAGLANCTTPLARPVSLPTASQKYLICSPSLLASIVPSTALAQATAMSAEASALSRSGSATTCVAPTTACEMSQNGSVPNIALPSAQTNGAASLPTQSVFEFSLLGLGAPTLLIGVLYLLLRRV